MDPNDTAAIIADLKRRIANLERASQLSNSSLQDDDGNTVSARSALLAGATAAGQLADVVEGLSDAQAIADGKVRAFYQATAPLEEVENPDYGDLWYSPDGSAYRYDGDTWILIQDAGVAADALDAAQSAQATADGKIDFFFATTAPPTAAQGDIWEQIDDDGNTVQRYRWDAGSWVPIPVKDFGATTVSSSSVSVNGKDLQAEFIDPLPRGVTAWADRTSTADTANIGSTETVVMEFNAGAISAGRVYRVVAQGYWQSSNANEGFYLRFRYTTNNTTPTALSPALWAQRFDTSTTISPFHMEKMMAGVDASTLRVALTIQRTVGTGTAHLFLTSADRNFSMYVEDVGDTGIFGALAQKSFSDGTPAEPSPVQTFTDTWTASWVRSFKGDGTTATGDPQVRLYQGAADLSQGDMRSLFGFDYADIQAKLAGATITDSALTYRVKYSSASTLPVYLSSHNYTAKPTTWAATSVIQSRATWTGNRAGVIYKKSLGTTIGNEFKNGTTRGLGFGPANSTSPDRAGYLYPDLVLTITYTK